MCSLTYPKPAQLPPTGGTVNAGCRPHASATSLSKHRGGHFHMLILHMNVERGEGPVFAELVCMMQLHRIFSA